MDNDLTAARNSSMFWHDMWVSCNKPETGWVYVIMKRIEMFVLHCLHYKLRGLKKLRQSKIKLSVSRSMMTSKIGIIGSLLVLLKKIVITTLRLLMAFMVTQKLQMYLNPNLVLSTVAFQLLLRPWNHCTRILLLMFATTVQIMQMKQMVIHIVMLLKEIMLNQPLTSSTQ